MQRVVHALHEADDRPNTAHSLNPVPLIVTDRGVSLAPTGALADAAPTVLALLEIRGTEGDDRPLAARARAGAAAPHTGATSAPSVM